MGHTGTSEAIIACRAWLRDFCPEGSLLSIPAWRNNLLDQRASPRRTYFAQVQVSVPIGTGEPQRIAGMVEDRSQSGFGLRLPKPIPIGSEIHVSLGNTVFRCEVKRCVPMEAEYLVGVYILPSAPAE
jgi:PilZ domain